MNAAGGPLRPLPLGIYLVTDPPMSGGVKETLAAIVASVDAGVTTVQIRWKNAPGGIFLDLALRTHELVGTKAAIIINDRIDVFLAARAQGTELSGVHIGQDDLPPVQVRDLIGPDALLGYSAGTPAELARANSLPPGIIDHIGVGVLRSTLTKQDAPPALGVEGINAIAKAQALPVVAIGGIKTSDIPGLASGGVHAAAIVSGILAATDPGPAAKEYVDLWRKNYVN
ncbi:MAG: thiamine phosphate synthase [Actinomycetaceae bacterium]|nr:thiamine phosphate synthase [Actinomycetaceae bacterium]